MSGAPDASCLFLFETTHQAMWAEDVAREGGIPAEVVAAPPEAKAKCGLALRTTGANCGTLEAAMAAAGIGFQPYAP
jgi:hypothetical protein